MKKESIVWWVGCLIIPLLLMLPSISLGDDKKETNYEELKSKCDEEQKSTACGKFENKFKPKLDNIGNLLFENLFLKGAYGYTNEAGTTENLGQSIGLAAKIEMTQTYGISLAYKDKTIVSNIMAFIQKPEKNTPLQDLVFDPIKLNANVYRGKVLKTTEAGVVTEESTVKTTYGVEISYCLPIEKLVYYLERSISPNATVFRPKRKWNR